MDVFLGSKQDRIGTGRKQDLRIIQDPNYQRFGSTVDLDSALETFVPHRSDPNVELQQLLFNF